MIYLKLFLTFLEIGTVSFGGGYGMIALVREAVLGNGWLTEEEFLNLIAVSESTPGPIAVNTATFVGSTQGGFFGALAATLGVVLPSFVIILVIAALVQIVELALKKLSHSLYQALGVYLPLITTNCAVLGVALLNSRQGYNLIESVVNGFSAAIGFTLAIVIFANIRERLARSNMPKWMEGFPGALIIAGLMSLAFQGFSGLL